MKPLHWRRLALAAAVALFLWPTNAPGQVASHVERDRASVLASDLAARRETAEQLVRQAVRVIRHARELDAAWSAERQTMDRLGPEGQPRDANRAALVGAELTPLVTTLGHFDAKWLSTDPRWAPALVRELASHGVVGGAVVAASFSGSFPGLNLSLMAACRALGARLVAVSSVTASTWGANEPGFTWPEMEALVVDAGVLPAASVAIGIGGSRDAGRDLEPEAQVVARRIQRDVARRLRAEALETTTLAGAISARMAAYDRALAGQGPAVYVNIGGNHASLGGARAALRHAEGWHLETAGDGSPSSGTIGIYAARCVPILNLLNVMSLAREWGLATEPRGESTP